MSRIILAPMEGLADAIMRQVLTDIGGYDWCVSEFVRVSGSVLPARTYYRSCPELQAGSQTRAGTPVRVQLLGSDPDWLADNASRLAKLNPAGIDLNFGCPAPLVNRHGGGAALLDNPELLHRIVEAIRPRVPRHLPFTAKMRLGTTDPAQCIACAQALAAGGVDELVVHGRTRGEGYRPPAHWAWIAKVREAVPIPVVANGEVWTVEDYHQCREESGCPDVMLGRGAIADPLLALRIRQPDHAAVFTWSRIQPYVGDYWAAVCAKVWAPHAPGRLKQWLTLMRRHYPEAETLYQTVRPLREVDQVTAVLQAAGCVGRADHG